MARSTLADRIADVRRMAGAGTASYSVDSVSYFSDAHVQDYLDRNRVDLIDVELMPRPVNVQGTATYLDYYAPYGNLEATGAGGSSVFVVRSAGGTIQGTALWSADYVRGCVSFTADQAGSAYYLTARAFDLQGAAADLLDDWAAHEALSFEFSTDNQSFKRNQKHEMLTKRARALRAQQTPRTARSTRRDLTACDDADEQPAEYRQIRVT